MLEQIQENKLYPKVKQSKVFNQDPDEESAKSSKESDDEEVIKQNRKRMLIEAIN